VSPDTGADLSWRHPAGSTAVFLGEGAVARARPWLATWAGERQVFLVTSPVVAALFLEEWKSVLDAAAEVVVLEVDEGEAAKTPAAAIDLWERMVAAGGRRDSRVVGLGGGSVSDLAGFVAATFLRGVEIVLAPTTLLAQVDAAIGGKTAIDLPAAKNSVGAFHHPAAVVADVACLATLPAAEIRSGLVEVLKIGAADDLPLFERLERDLETLLIDREPEILSEVVRAAVAAKIRVVEADPGESDRRRLLNMGHTLGHALEVVLGYQGLRHGEAVAYGLVFAARLAANSNGDVDWLSRVVDLVGRLSLPALPPLDLDSLLEALRRDKKATRLGLFWVLPMTPGTVGITAGIPLGYLRDELSRFVEDPLSLT